MRESGTNNSTDDKSMLAFYQSQAVRGLESDCMESIARRVAEKKERKGKEEKACYRCIIIDIKSRCGRIRDQRVCIYCRVR